MSADKYKPRREIIAKIQEGKEKQDIRNEKTEQRRARLHEFKDLCRIWGVEFLKKSNRDLKKFRRLGKRWYKTIYQGVAVCELELRVNGSTLLRKGIGHLQIGVQNFLRTSRVGEWQIASQFSRRRHLIFSGLFISFVFLNIGYSEQRYMHPDLGPHLQAVNYWPLAPAATLTLAKQAAEQGYEDLAATSLREAERVINWWSVWGVESWETELKYQETFQLVNRFQLLRAQLVDVNRLISLYPYSRVLLLKRIEILIGLNQIEKVRANLETLSWLDPQKPLPSVLENLERSQKQDADYLP